MKRRTALLSLLLITLALGAVTITQARYCDMATCPLPEATATVTPYVPLPSPTATEAVPAVDTAQPEQQEPYPEQPTAAQQEPYPAPPTATPPNPYPDPPTVTPPYPPGTTPTAPSPLD